MKRLLLIIAIGASLQGCAALAALPLATQVTIATGVVGGLAVVTNTDIAIINEYCKLRSCTAPAVVKP